MTYHSKKGEKKKIKNEKNVFAFESIRLTCTFTAPEKTPTL